MTRPTQVPGFLRRAAVLLVVAIGALAVSVNAHQVRAQATAQVTISGYAFHSATLTVAPGTTVTWTNQQSGVTHTVTSDASSLVQWDSGMLPSGASFSFTFTQAGTYTYHCSIHPGMQGSIIVQASNAPAPTDTPVPTPTETPVPPTATPTPTRSVKKTILTTSKNGVYLFSIKKATIHTGTRVVWKNTSNARHTITSVTASWKFDKQLAPGKSVSYVFTKPGTYRYVCKYHPGMKASLTVRR